MIILKILLLLVNLYISIGAYREKDYKFSIFAMFACVILVVDLSLEALL